ncbi:ferrous iron transport protein A, partial [Eubacterium sp. AF15-50]
MVIWKKIYVLHIGGIKLKLSQLKQGQTGRIVKVGGEGQLRRHFLDMGLI